MNYHNISYEAGRMSAGTDVLFTALAPPSVAPFAANYR
jgi:hypothetical protein